MSCDICGRGSCCASFHSLDEQARYEKVIAAFDRARELRTKVKTEAFEEETEKTLAAIAAIHPPKES
jgi:hypothetical protein